MSLRLNPFAVGTLTSIPYDFYVRNPYELTIGNFTQVFATSSSLITKAAAGCFIAIGAFYTLMLYGATTYGAGHLIERAGDWLDSPKVEIVGQKVKKAGEYIFLAGSISLYALTYALPKNIIRNIPSCSRYLATKIQEFAIVFYKYILHPSLNAAYSALQWSWNKLGVAFQKVSAVVLWMIDNVLVPLWQPTLDRLYDLGVAIFDRIVVPLWSDVIVPSLHRLYNAAVWIVEALPTLAAKTVEVFNRIVVPFWNNTIMPALYRLYDGVVWVGEAFAKTVSKTVEAFKWVCNHSIVPLWNNIIAPTVRGLYKAVVWTGNAIATAVTKTAEAFSWVVNHLIVPLWTEILEPAIPLFIDGVIWAGETLIELAGTTAEAAQWVFSQMINYLKSNIPLFRWFYNTSAQALSFAARKTVETARSIFKQTVVPASKVFASALQFAGAALAHGFQQIGEAAEAAQEAGTAAWRRATSRFN